MNNNDIYFGLYHVDVADRDMSLLTPDHPSCVGFVDTAEVDALFPINPATGMRSDILSQIVDPSTGDLKRNQLLSAVDHNPQQTHRNVDDNTLLSLLKSRYTQSRVENDTFMRYVEQIVIDSKKPTVSADPSSAAVPSPAAQSSPAAEPTSVTDPSSNPSNN